ncbi:MAG: hypothetical protein QM681_17435 [Novosphingobium sp.]
MAELAIPFSARFVTPADCLLDMLETVTTKRDFSVWSRDYLDHKHLLSLNDDRNLVRLGASRWCELDREAV